MIEQDFNQLISESVDAVLQTMFFSESLGAAEPESGVAVLEARLAFRGNPSGTLSVRISEPSAQLLAANFLGEDEAMLTNVQSRQMACELANMVCGSLVSKLQSEAHFDLDAPQLVLPGIAAEAHSAASATVCRSFELENGILTVTLYLDSAS